MAGKSFVAFVAAVVISLVQVRILYRHQRRPIVEHSKKMGSREVSEKSFPRFDPNRHHRQDVDDYRQGTFMSRITIRNYIDVSDSCTSNTYRGAVVEYNAVLKGSGAVPVEENVNNYMKFMELAASKGAEIIVFPEQGLVTDVPSFIPNPSDQIAPCDSTVTTKAIRDLSCASRKYKIYSVVNALELRNCDEDDKNCPPSGFYKLNTNVAFDRAGVVIARYSKYNIYVAEEQRIKDPEFSFFDTDFGVRFGTFVCFDILFSLPAQRLIHQYGITDFVFTSKWYSELPFLTALQIQKGWAEALNVNLLASGFNNPAQGSSGSGIYNGKFGHLTHFMPETPRSKLLIADIPKINLHSCPGFCPAKESGGSSLLQASHNSTDFSPESAAINQRSFLLLREKVELYTTAVITPGKTFKETVCSKEDFCCDFNVSVEALDKASGNFTLRAMVFNGIRKFGTSHFLKVQSCGVVACNGAEVSNCTNRAEKIPGVFKFKEIVIKGNFKLRNSFQMPTTLTDGKVLEPLPAYKYEFLRSEKGGSVEVSMTLLWPVKDLYAFGIWGRDFTGDGEPETSLAPARVSVPVLLATLFGFLLFAR